MAIALLLFLPNRKTKYFWRRGWTPKSRNSPSGKSVGAQTIHDVEQQRLYSRARREYFGEAVEDYR